MATVSATLRSAMRSRYTGVVTIASNAGADTIVHQLTAQSVGGLGASGSAQALTLAPQAVSNYEFYVILRGSSVAAAAQVRAGVASWNGSQASLVFAASVADNSTIAYDVICVDPSSPTW